MNDLHTSLNKHMAYLKRVNILCLMSRQLFVVVVEIKRLLYSVHCVIFVTFIILEMYSVF